MENQTQTTEDNSNKVYALPAEIVAALQSDRPEFLKMLVKTVQAGSRKFNKNEICQLLELIHDLLQDRYTNHKRIEQLEHEADQAGTRAQHAIRILLGKPNPEMDTTGL